MGFVLQVDKTKLGVPSLLQRLGEIQADIIRNELPTYHAQVLHQTWCSHTAMLIVLL